MQQDEAVKTYKMNIDIKFSDAVIFKIIQTYRSKSYWITSSIAGLFFAILVNNFETQDTDLIVITLMSTLGFMLGVLLFLCLLIPSSIFSAMENLFVKGSLGQRVLEIDSRNITETTKHSKKVKSWSQIKRIYFSNKFILIKYSSFHGFLIPCKEFEKYHLYIQFYADILRYHQQSHNK